MFDFGTDASGHEQNFIRYCASRNASGKRHFTGRVKTRKRRYQRPVTVMLNPRSSRAPSGSWATRGDLPGVPANDVLGSFPDCRSDRSVLQDVWAEDVESLHGKSVP